MIEGKAETGSLVTGGISAIFASACCVGPLILVSVGISGAWISYLTILEPYRWIFIGIALAALAFAWHRIYRPAAQCEPGQVCAVARKRRVYRAAFWMVAAIVVVAAAFPYAAPYVL